MGSLAVDDDTSCQALQQITIKTDPVKSVNLEFVQAKGQW
jgi:hypothetical protein